MERILIVDDEIEICNTLHEFFSLRGYEAHMAFDGPTAIRKVKEVRPHIVFLDMIMPGMGGIDVLKEIKKIDPTVGVVMLSAVIDHELAKRSLELGAYDYLTKPIDLEYLETVAMVTIVNLLD